MRSAIVFCFCFCFFVFFFRFGAGHSSRSFIGWPVGFFFGFFFFGWCLTFGFGAAPNRRGTRNRSPIVATGGSFWLFTEFYRVFLCFFFGFGKPRLHSARSSSSGAFTESVLFLFLFFGAVVTSPSSSKRKKNTQKKKKKTNTSRYQRKAKTNSSETRLERIKKKTTEKRNETPGNRS